MSDKKYGTLCCISGGACPQIESAVGIIKAIQAATLTKFDTIWGTSAGAIVGSLLMSMGQDISKFESVLKASDISDWFVIKVWQAIKSLFGKSNYVADNTGLKNFLCENLTDEALKKVMVGVSDMGEYGSEPKFVKPIMLPAEPKTVLASMSIQHVFPPVVWGGRMYQDGGVNNLCPIPSYMDISKYEHIYIILAARVKLLPKVFKWSFLNQLIGILDSTMDREVAQIEEFKLDEAPNVTILRPDSWVKSASFLDWSDNFEQIDASYEYALKVLEQKGLTI